MKYILTKLYVCILVLFVHTIGYAASTSMITHKEFFNSNLLQIIEEYAPDGTEYIKCIYPGLKVIALSGEPALLSKTLQFEIPINATNPSIRIYTGNKKYSYILKSFLIPVQFKYNNETNNSFIHSDSLKYQIEYNAHAKIVDNYILNDEIRILKVELMPFDYNATSGNLNLYSEIEIEISYTYRAFSEEDKRKLSSNNTQNEYPKIEVPLPFDNIIESNSNNYITLPNRYVIVTTRGLLHSFSELATWKKQKGYNVKLITIEDILENNKYRINESSSIKDSASALRAFLIDEKKNGLFFCLIGGDEKSGMPVRRVKKHRIDDPTAFVNQPSMDVHEENYIPTDNYFSDLSSEWNLEKELDGSYSCFIDSINYNPTIYVGRLLCNTSEHVKNYTRKLMIYEANPGNGNTAYLNNSLYVVQEGCYDSYVPVRNSLLRLPNNNILFDSEIGNNEDNIITHPTGNEVISALKHSGYASLYGHGCPVTIGTTSIDGWTENWNYIKPISSFDLSNLYQNYPIKTGNSFDELDNYDFPGVIYTIACASTPFDILSEWHNFNKEIQSIEKHWTNYPYDFPYNFGSAYTTAGLYGGVAFLGNTRKGWLQHSNFLEQTFGNLIKVTRKIGIAEALSKKGFPGGEDAEYAKAHLSTIHTHNLIGDPDIDLWLKEPEQMNSRIKQIPTAISFFNLEPESKICLYNGKNIVSLSIPEKNYTTIQIGRNQNNILLSSIWKSGYIPQLSLLVVGDIPIDSNKYFVLNKASLPASESENLNFPITISNGGNLVINAHDGIDMHRLCKIENMGSVLLQSEGETSVSSLSVENGGCLIINSQTATLGEGFCIKQGGTLNIITN